MTPEERVPPHDLAAERAALGACLVDPSVLPAVFATARPRDFYAQAHQTIAKALLDLHELGVPADVVLLREALQRAGELERAGGEETIHDLAEATPTAANAEHYARIIRDHALRRRAIDGMRGRMDRFYSPNGSPVAEDLRAVESDFRDLAESAGETAGPAGGLVFQTVDELETLPECNVEWLIPGLLAVREVTLLAAAVKLGKTYFTFGMLRALETGADFAGFPTRRANAVYLSEETSAGILEKARHFGLRTTVFLTRENFSQRLSFREYVDAAAAEAKRRGASLVVVDTFRRFGRLGADKEKDAGAVDAVLEDALLVAAREHLSFLIAHHHRKVEGEDTDQIAGSNALPGSVDTILQLRRLEKEHGPVRIVEASGRHRETPTESFSVELRGGLYVRLGCPADVKKQKAKEKVLAILGTGPRTRQEILDAGGGQQVLLATAIYDLTRENAIAKSGQGKAGDPFRYSLSMGVPSTGTGKPSGEGVCLSPPCIGGQDTHPDPVHPPALFPETGQEIGQGDG